MQTQNPCTSPIFLPPRSLPAPRNDRCSSPITEADISSSLDSFLPCLRPCHPEHPFLHSCPATHPCSQPTHTHPPMPTHQTPALPTLKRHRISALPLFPSMTLLAKPNTSPKEAGANLNVQQHEHLGSASILALAWSSTRTMSASPHSDAACNGVVLLTFSSIWTFAEA